MRSSLAFEAPPRPRVSPPSLPVPFLIGAHARVRAFMCLLGVKPAGAARAADAVLGTPSLRRHPHEHHHADPSPLHTIPPLFPSPLMLYSPFTCTSLASLPVAPRYCSSSYAPMFTHTTCAPLSVLPRSSALSLPLPPPPPSLLRRRCHRNRRTWWAAAIAAPWSARSLRWCLTLRCSHLPRSTAFTRNALLDREAGNA